LNNKYQLELEQSKSTANLQLEQGKAEATRILEMIKTSDADKAAENLKFLVDSGLVGDGPLNTKIRSFLADRKPGTGPVLSGPSPVAGSLGAHVNCRSQEVDLRTVAAEIDKVVPKFYSTERPWDFIDASIQASKDLSFSGGLHVFRIRLTLVKNGPGTSIFIDTDLPGTADGIASRLRDTNITCIGP
jgi:hypothetical protein